MPFVFGVNYSVTNGGLSEKEQWQFKIGPCMDIFFIKFSPNA